MSKRYKVKNEWTRCTPALPPDFRYRCGDRFNVAAERGKLMRKVSQATHIKTGRKIKGVLFLHDLNDHFRLLGSLMRTYSWGCGGGIVFSVIAFYSKDPSSNPTPY